MPLQYRFPLHPYPYFDDDHPTITSQQQRDVEQSIDKCYRISSAILEVDPQQPCLNRAAHIRYLKKGLFQKLPSSTQSMDCSRGWIVYWITHSLFLLDADANLTPQQKKQIALTLSRFQNPAGGFGGGPQQLSHLAATYAVVNALFSLGCELAHQVIDKNAMYQYLLSIKQADGSYLMHVDGETDVRGIYCALSVATLLEIVDDKLTSQCAEWICTCQTYEGGFGGYPGAEAHGGYTFCAVAALALLRSLDKCDVKSLLRFVVNRQQSFEGGFSGRTNKLVDGCYSFWVGGVFPILDTYLSSSDSKRPTDRWLFHQEALQEYLLCCCQETSGGMIDKPDKKRDFYHTCYGLSGLSVAQNTISADAVCVGDPENQLNSLHPIFNVTLKAIEAIKRQNTL